MKIGIIQNCNHDSSHQLDMLGRTQAGYLIQLGLAWFSPLDKLDLVNKVVIFTTPSAYDLEPALLASNCPNLNYEIPIEMIDPRWGSCGDVLSSGESKSETLAKRIDEFEREHVLVFAFFYDNDDDSNVSRFLDYYKIEKQDKWPTVFQPALIRIDTDAKTIDYDFAPLTCLRVF